jgi:hypothetical protein
MAAAVNSVANGLVTPVSGVTPVDNSIPTAAEPLGPSLQSGLSIFLDLGITV